KDEYDGGTSRTCDGVFFGHNHAAGAAWQQTRGDGSSTTRDDDDPYNDDDNKFNLR
ncbi:hypothetical protein A2U01_0117312, partial [Trifolium medium]|nr:hypothetical protein [Trifolium medium]